MPWFSRTLINLLLQFSLNTDPVLNSFTLKVLSAYTSLPTVQSDEAGRADSDFHSWTNCGYHASYFAEGPVDDIVYGNDKHTPWDRFEGVSISHVQQIAQGAMGFILELSQIETIGFVSFF